jgi:acyl-CoA thioesterase-1
MARVTTTPDSTEDECRTFIRYTRTRRWPMLERFPVDDRLHTELLTQMAACEPATVLAFRQSMADEVQETAARMMAGHRYGTAVRRLPFDRNDRIVAVGDSITADRLGWFELMTASVRLAGTAPEALVNQGRSGDTTADVLERFDLLESARPSRVMVMLGTNDARAHGRASRHRMVSPPETERNLRALISLITDDLNASVTVLTPPAIDQQRVTTYFAGAPLSWHSSAVSEVAEAVRKVAPTALDLHTATLQHGLDRILEPDGVHPTLAGQQFIATSLVNHLVGYAWDGD